MTRTRRTTTVAQRVASVVVGVLITLPVAGLALVATAAPAQATTYRYWTYWWGSATGKTGTGWTFAPVGPAGHRVADTWVLGWRFETSSTTTASEKPRQSPDFGTLCPSLTGPVDGQDRVALVVDYGTSADAPPGQTPPSTSTVRVECLTLPASPHETGAQVLAAAQVTVRSENGLICALDGYPVGECAPVVPDPAASPTPAASSPRPRTSTAPASARPVRTGATSGAIAPTRAAGAGQATTPGAATVSPSSTTGSPTDTTASAAATSPDPTDSMLPAAAGAPATTAEQSAGSPVGLLVGGAVVAAVAGSAWWTSRRRGQQR